MRSAVDHFDGGEFRLMGAVKIHLNHVDVHGHGYASP